MYWRRQNASLPASQISTTNYTIKLDYIYSWNLTATSSSVNLRSKIVNYFLMLPIVKWNENYDEIITIQVSGECMPNLFFWQTHLLSQLCTHITGSYKWIMYFSSGFCVFFFLTKCCCSFTTRAGSFIVPVVSWEGPAAGRGPPNSCQIFNMLFWRLNVQCRLKCNDDD